MKLDVWMVVRVGVHKSLDAGSRTLAKFRVSSWAADAIKNPGFTLSECEEDIELCVATVMELTDKTKATLEEIFDAICRIGCLCPAEVGVALREHYSEQPNGDMLFIAMEPLRDSPSILLAFQVSRENHGEVCLNAYLAGPGGLWSGNARFVFRRRKVTAE